MDRWGCRGEGGGGESIALEGLTLPKIHGNLRLYLVTIFVFYFQKLVFENIKKKQFSCIFEIKNMFG